MQEFPSPMPQYDHQIQELLTANYLASPCPGFTALLNERSSSTQAPSFAQQLGEAEGPVAEINCLYDSSNFPPSPASMIASVGGGSSPANEDYISMGPSLYNCCSQEKLFPDIQSNHADPYYQPQSGMLTQQQPMYQTHGQYYHQEQEQYQPAPCTSTHQEQQQHQPVPCTSTHQEQQQHQPVPCTSTHQEQQQHQPVPCTSTHQEAIGGVQVRQRRRRAKKTLTPSEIQCDKCLKTFTRPYNLKSHARTHTKERPFPCSHPGCNRAFARPHDRKRHGSIHSGIKPFHCPCGKSFSRSDALKKHQTFDAICGTQKTNKKKNACRRS
jgi:uncharacterized Zn-finger protein